jgi:hypothetical protein
MTEILLEKGVKWNKQTNIIETTVLLIELLSKLDWIDYTYIVSIESLRYMYIVRAKRV